MKHYLLDPRVDYMIDLMKSAHQISKHSKHTTKVGCVVSYKQQILGAGFNYSHGDKWVHAEEEALLNIPVGISPNTKFIATVNWYPCLDCAIKLYNANVRTLVYEISKTESRWNDPKYSFPKSKDFIDAHFEEIIGIYMPTLDSFNPDFLQST